MQTLVDCTFVALAVLAVGAMAFTVAALPALIMLSVVARVLQGVVS